MTDSHSPNPSDHSPENTPSPEDRNSEDHHPEPGGKNESHKPAERVRLNKFLASAGLGSRRKCEELILQGRVSVGGEDVTDLAHTVDPDADIVRVDYERVKPARIVYYLLNKPVGTVCTHNDPQGRPRAVDLVPDRNNAGLFTVGRLDESSRGLLLVTNDGDLAHRLAHPRFQVPRTYRVQVAGVPDRDTISQLLRGFHFSDGKFWFNAAKRLKTQGRSAFLEVELKQGRNREIRRMFSRVGHKVISLERVSFGPLRLGGLAPGEFRSLREDEIRRLKEFARRGRRFGDRVQRGTVPNRSNRSSGRGDDSRSESRGGSSGSRRGAARDHGGHRGGRDNRGGGGSRSGRGGSQGGSRGGSQGSSRGGSQGGNSGRNRGRR